MRPLSSFAPLLFALPLAACFDAEMTLSFPDENTGIATMTMIAGQDIYDMAAASGEPFCEDGEETQLDDGRYSCTQIFSGTVDEVMNDPEVGEGMTIERRGDGLLFVSFDLAEITADMGPPPEAGEDAEMLAMMAEAFQGHTITMNVAGSEIVETNGTMSDDGKMASFQIPLGDMVTGGVDLPSSFDTVVRPGT
jgi:uncharacterized Zn-binding protein involved in type VI secretion